MYEKGQQIWIKCSNNPSRQHKQKPNSLQLSFYHWKYQLISPFLRSECKKSNLTTNPWNFMHKRSVSLTSCPVSLVRNRVRKRKGYCKRVSSTTLILFVLPGKHRGVLRNTVQIVPHFAFHRLQNLVVRDRQRVFAVSFGHQIVNFRIRRTASETIRIFL